MKILPVIALLLLLASCQKEFNAPFSRTIEQPEIPEVSAIVKTNGTQGDYDSISYHYLTGRTLEIHHNYWGDSTVRTYYYDASARLAKIEDEKAIYYTNNDTARQISFMYNNSGDLIETLTDFVKISGIRAYYNNSHSGNTKTITAFDTAYRSSYYDLDWANRVIYTTVSSNNSLLYDSCIYYNYLYGHVKTVVSTFVYGAGNNITAINKLIYHDMHLAETGTTYIIRDKPAPVFEALRNELYRNLAGWYQTSSVMQDDSYQHFPLPGTMYKSIEYTGRSSAAGPLAEEVKRGYSYQNDYRNGLLYNSKVTYTMSGQGNTNYSFYVRYYYR